MPYRFLTAEWSHLMLCNYAVAPELLAPLLPAGAELDTWQGETFVSLVVFDFLNTRVLGIPWPGYRNFPELNLRFYVRVGDRRGVVFIREIVPKRLVCWMARLIYGEPYFYAPMESSVKIGTDRLEMNRTITWHGRKQTLHAVGRLPGAIPGPESVEHFFKEHRWGFSRSTQPSRTHYYEVLHPHWEVFPLEHYDIDFDFSLVYGPAWSPLNQARPHSVVLARGSGVEVYNRQTLSFDK